jgi:hypothetical protein
MELFWTIIRIYLIGAFSAGILISLYILWLFHREERKIQSET